MLKEMGLKLRIRRLCIGLQNS